MGLLALIATAILLDSLSCGTRGHVRPQPVMPMAVGLMLEARMDRARGAVCTVLVHDGAYGGGWRIPMRVTLKVTRTVFYR